MDDLAETPESIHTPFESPETVLPYLCRILPKDSSDVFGIKESRRGAETALPFPAHVNPRNEEHGAHQVLWIDS